MTLAPLTDAAWPPEAARLLPDFAGRLNVYRVMAHHPALLNAWEGLRNHVVLDSVLTGEQRELIILRVGFRWRAGYEWAHHVSRGRAAGLSEDQISAAAAPAPEAASDLSSALFAAVDSLLADGQLPPDVLRALGPYLNEKGVLDLMATVGMYSTLAFLAKTFAVPIEPDLADLDPHW
jgi:alkylhydroperoxidase family enzyme